MSICYLCGGQLDDKAINVKNNIWMCQQCDMGCKCPKCQAIEEAMLEIITYEPSEKEKQEWKKTRSEYGDI